MAVDESGKDKVIARPKDAVEWPASLHLGPRSDRRDHAIVDDDAPVGNQGLSAEAHDRVPDDQITGHYLQLPPSGTADPRGDRRSPGTHPGSGQASGGTTIRSTTRRNASLASRSTFCSSTVTR